MSSGEPSIDTGAPAASGISPGDARASSAIDLQERERVRIGFDLHDGPAQTMSAALLQVRMLQDLDGNDLQRGLAELRSTLSLALGEIYGLIENLGGRDTGDTDLVTRVRSCVEAFKERHDIDVEFTVHGDCGEVSPSLQIATFRIVQEALSNVGRHSGACHARVDLRLTPETVSAEIVDDGDGFVTGTESVSRRSNREPFGLRSMSTRARLLDGDCNVESEPGRGTRVQVTIPVWRG